MIGWVASLQPLVVATLLGWAGTVKLRGLRTEQQVKRSAVSRIVGEAHTSAVWRLVGGLELLVAVALLLPPAYPAKTGAAAVLCAGFLGYLGYAKLAAPDASCGCLSAKLAPVSWRSFARAGLLLAASLLSFGYATDWWPSSVATHPLAAVVLVLAELALLGMFSVELDDHWLVPLRKLRVRLTHPLANKVHTVPLEATVEQLQLSEAYRQFGAMITSDVLDSWEEGDWRLLEYAVRTQDRTATAVFAVPLATYDPDSVRVALVEPASA
jgi:hypothetical protein